MSTDRDLTIEEIRDPARLEAIEVPWNQLLAAHLFQTRGRLLGLPLTVLQSMTNEHSFRFDVLLRDGAELAGERGWRRLHFLRFGGRAIAF